VISGHGQELEEEQKHMVRFLVSVMAIAAIAITAGCGGSSSAKIDSAGVEKALKARVESSSSVKVQSLNCPDGVEQKKGISFSCDLTTTEGLTGKMNVTQEDDTASTFSWKAKLSGGGTTMTLSESHTG
jgi:hypothetical protein